METIVAFAASAASAIGIGSGAAAATGTAATVASTTAAATAAGFTATPAMLSAGAAGISASGLGLTAGGILSALRIGSTAVTALSINAQANAQAQAMKAEGRDAEMQANQELIQSQEQSNQIEREYNSFVEQTLAAASASGFDIGSGSVQDARERARADADRQLTINRNGAQMNAALRRSRASRLKDGAKITRQAGALGAAGYAAGGGIDVSRLG